MTGVERKLWAEGEGPFSQQFKNLSYGGNPANLHCESGLLRWSLKTWWQLANGHKSICLWKQCCENKHISDCETPGYHKKKKSSAVKREDASVSDKQLWQCLLKLFCWVVPISNTKLWFKEETCSTVFVFFSPFKAWKYFLFQNQMNKVYIQTLSDPQISHLNSIKSNSPAKHSNNIFNSL